MLAINFLYRSIPILQTPFSNLINQVLNAVMVWVRHDTQLRLNLVGDAVCEYFDRLFDVYPLNKEGLQINSEAAYEILRIFRERARACTLDRQYAIEIADYAEKASFLMRRPHDMRKEEEDIVTEQPLPVINPELAPLFAHEADLRDFLHQMISSPPVKLYYRLLADDGLTPLKWRTFLERVIAASKRINSLSATATICVFIDELNTAGCLGMVTEAFLMHSLDGVSLPSNIFFVGAVNPYRDSSTPPGIMDFTKSNIGQYEEDDTPDYQKAYIVRQLSPGMENLKVWYPNLDDNAERSFLREYFDLHFCVPKPIYLDDSDWEIEFQQFSAVAQSMIVRAQLLVRGYNVPRVFMSIRNLIRCTHLLTFLMTFTVPTERGADGIAFNHQNIFLPGVNDRTDHQPVKGEEGFDAKNMELKKKMRSALIMSISVTYMFQLPSHGHVIAGKAKEDLRLLFIRY